MEAAAGVRFERPDKRPAAVRSAANYDNAVKFGIIKPARRLRRAGLDFKQSRGRAMAASLPSRLRTAQGREF